MKFFDKKTYMNNYFSDTPIYKIWIDVINYLSPRTSFLVDVSKYRFVDLVCKREDVTHTYERDNHKLELVFAYENRSFFCRLVDVKTGVPIPWKGTPPMPNSIKNSFSDLGIQVDLWLVFLKSEL